MKSGIMRRFDSGGRIVIPMEIRRSMNLTEKDAIEIYVEDGRIILERYETGRDIDAVIEILEECIKNEKYERADEIRDKLLDFCERVRTRKI